MDTLAQEHNHAQNLVTVRNIVLLVSSIILAAGYDILIAQPAVAVSYPVFILASLFVVYANAKHLLVKRPGFGWFLAFPLLALALTRFLFANEILRVLNSVVVPILFVAHALLVTGNSRYEWFRCGFLKDIFGGLIICPLRYATKPFILVGAMMGQESKLTGRSVFGRVMAGLVLSLPVLIVVVILLSSADQVFEFLIRTLLANINVVEIARHSLLIGFVTLLVFGFLWGLHQMKPLPGFSEYETKKLDGITIISGLCVLAAVYGLFCTIQFSYLFGSLSNLLPDGLTYADYARRGFFELVAVAIINTCLVIGTLNFSAVSGLRTARALKVLNSILVFSTFVMLISAHFRMSLYEETFGYTYLRVFTHAFMIMMFVMLCATLYKVWADRINLAKWYIMIGLITFVLINYINVDTVIAQKNVERYRRIGAIDVDYLAGLSYDAMPYLIALTQDSDWKVELAARQYIARKQTTLFASRSWQGFNLSELRAKSYMMENPVPDRYFDQQLWNSDKYQRAVLVHDLLAAQSLMGKSKKNITELIGEPEYGYKTAECYAWPLWSHLSPQGYDKVLWIWFTKNGSVYRYSVDSR